MTKRITSEDCEGNIEDIEDGRYNSHVVPVSAEDDPGYEEIDYGDCTEFTVPLGRYGSHVVPIGGGGGGVSGAACPNGGLKAGTNIDGKDCLSVNLKPGGAIILDNGQLAIDTSKLKITTDQVYPSGTDTGIVIDGLDGESWDTQYDYNQWLYNEITNLDLSDYVTHTELMLDQQRQDMALIVDQMAQDTKWAKDQERQDLEYEAKFVEVEGDTMTGDLIVDAVVHAKRVETLYVDSGENSNLKLQHDGITKVYVGREQVTITNPLQLNTEGTLDNHAVTKKYIDDTKDFLQNEIIELEEEIDAIASSGGDASSFLLKSGDKMTGDLTIDRSVGNTDVESRLTITGSQPDSRPAAAVIKFINSQTTEPGFLSFRSGSGGTWFTFDQDLDLNNHGLHTVKQIRLNPGGYIGAGNNPLLRFDNDAVNYVGKMDSDTNLVNKAYVDAAAGPTVVLIGSSCKWRKGGLPVSSLTGTQYFGIEKAGDTSSQIGYGNVLYLNKLIAIDGTLQPLKNYTPTDGSLIEVWYGNELYFKSLLDPTTYKVASRNPDEIVCDCTTSRPLVSKSGVSWSTSLTYTIILTGMKSNG